MKNIFVLVCLFAAIHADAQNVGIGTNTPKARLHVADSSVVFSADGPAEILPDNPPPIEGTGRRMMWYAELSAFRAGYVAADQWDMDNIGRYSFAAGSSNIAYGSNSVAFGSNTQALQSACFAAGSGTIANGNAAFATGIQTKATGPISTAIGYLTTASAAEALATGYNTTASGVRSTAIGSNVSTNGMEGCLIIGDHSTSTVMTSGAANGFRARFAGGYRFFTSSDLTTNAYLAAGDNAWSTSSSMHLKENFEPVNGELILDKIAGMHLTTWNYKGQQPNSFRHYGPMAQDFFAAFGKDDYGTIGNDTTINQADFDGVNLIAIQALEKRTSEQNIVIKELGEKNDELKKKNEILEARIEKLESLIVNK